MADQIKKLSAGHSIEVLDAIMTEVEEARGEYDNLGERLDEMSSDTPTPSTAAPAMDGTAAAGTSTDYARADHIHPSDTSKASATSEAEDRAALIELVDGGAKNVVFFDSVGSSGETSITNAGITFTIQPDYSIKATGTANPNANAFAYLRIGGETCKIDDNCDGNHILSGSPPNGTQSTYRMYIPTTGYAQAEYGNGLLLPDNSTATNIIVACFVAKGYVIPADNPLIFKPMICSKAAWDISHTYQPYRPSYQELYDMVKALQAAT